MIRAALLLASAIAATPVMVQVVPASDVTIALSPPTDHDMLLTISDRRTLPNGETATFAITHTLRFTATVDGWDVVMIQQSSECAGPASVCRAYRSSMTEAIGDERHYVIRADGSIAALPDHAALASDDGAGSPGNAAMIVAAAETQDPGALRAGELREMLGFVGRRFALEEGGTSPIGANTARLHGDGLIAIEENQQLERANQPNLIRRTSSFVDRHSGLLMSSRIETRVAGQPETGLLSARTWRLEPVSRTP